LLGEQLASLAMEQAADANQAADSGVVLAAWMQTTGAELANAGVTTDAPLRTSPAVASGSSGGSDAADGDGFPVWAAIAVVALLIGVGAWLKLRDS
jgi:hypothetical protein